MNKTLYKDKKYELAYNDSEMYISINNCRYELSYHSYESCTYIKTKDGAVNIVMDNPFDLSIVKKDFENGMHTNGGSIHGNVSALEFCEIINTLILKDKALKKQQVAKETGYKTASNFKEI